MKIALFKKLIAPVGLGICFVVLFSCTQHKSQQEMEAAEPAVTSDATNQDTSTTNTTDGKAAGIDVSHFQGDIDWTSVKADGLIFAFAKASGGVDYQDPTFEQNWQGMASAGVLRGAYHYYYPADDPTQQAQNFVNVVKELDLNGLPPVVDIEESQGQTAEAITTGLMTWLETVEAQLGRRPIIYTGLSFGNTYLTNPELGGYALWIADYNTTEQGVPSPWQESGWTFWQYSSTLTIDGIDGDVDSDVFKGDQKELLQFIADYGK